MPKKTRAEELTELFNKTPEMQECQQTAGSIKNRLDPEDTVSIKIEVPKEFVRLTEFLEEGDKAEGANVEAAGMKFVRIPLTIQFSGDAFSASMNPSRDSRIPLHEIRRSCMVGSPSWAWASNPERKSLQHLIRSRLQQPAR